MPVILIACMAFMQGSAFAIDDVPAEVIASAEAKTNSDYTLYLLIISIGVNIVLVTATVAQVWIYRKEIKTRVRPWVGRDVERADGKLSIDKEKKALVFRIVNKGQLPARNVSLRYFLSTDRPTDEMLNDIDGLFDKNESKLLDDNPFDMLPEEGLFYRISLADNYKDAMEGSLFSGIFINYSSGKTRLDKLGAINGKYIIISEWERGIEKTLKIAVS